MDLVLEWPQLVYLAFAAFGFGVVIAKHGEPQKPYNALVSLIAQVIVLALLWWGGFFTGGAA